MFIFDNSNLNESYSGLVSPMTFSFAGRVYRKVYIQFCQLLGVSDRLVYSHQDIFQELVCLVGGRMYYNLVAWHRMMLLLPAYNLTGKYLEQMMGIPQKQQGAVVLTGTKPAGVLQAVWLLPRSIFLFCFMGRLISRFDRGFEKKYRRIGLQLKSAVDLDVVQAMKIYLRAEDELTGDFKTPIVNDFAVMVSVGLLRQICKSWNMSAVVNTLISGLPGIKSSEPGLLFVKILRSFNSAPLLKDYCQNHSPEEVYALLTMDKRFNKQLDLVTRYLSDYGSRMPGELKLESLSFRDNPLHLISLIRNSLENISHLSELKAQISSVKTDKLRLLLLNPLINWVKISISRRESTRFKRTLVFGIARDFITAMGNKLFSLGKLDSARDIYWLTLEELESFSKTKNYRALVRKRQHQQEIYRSLELPSRIESPNQVVPLSLLRKLSGKTRKDQGNSVTGTVACRGSGLDKVLGEAIVVKSFNPDLNYVNKILVAPQTDPGWTIIFPVLRGIIVDRGGILSHAAIVSREFGIPCIVGAPNSTSVFTSGQKLRMDLSDGRIEVA